jgi:hypothetical protein
MDKRWIALCLAASAALAACSTYEPPRTAALVATAVPVVPPVVALRPGVGTVVAILPMIDSEGGIRRLSLRMADGSLQVADSRGPFIAVGQQVEITPDRRIVYSVPRRYAAL